MLPSYIGSIYNTLNLPDQDLCPELFLCTEVDVLEILPALDTAQLNGLDGTSAINNVETNSS